MALFQRSPEPRRLGIYVHIPFCKTKCEYCDFYSLGGKLDRHMTDDYLQALADHIKESGRLAPDYRVDSVYFGGGTPSYFGPENLERILDMIQGAFRLSREAEISFEANPDSVSKSGLKKLLKAGFNRISLGVQSDDDNTLKKLGRPHNFREATEAMQAAREVGFTNISLDLMFGLPGQNQEAWEKTVERICHLRPEHISCYGLKVEENTPLWGYKDLIQLPDDDQQAAMYLSAVQILRDHGYEHYEISNFARKGFACRHNLKYWLGGEYLGFGPTAASDFAGKRFTVMADLRGYIGGIETRGQVLSECEAIPLRERAGEYVMLRLRTADGIQADEYERQYLMPFQPLEQLLQRFADKGLAEKNAQGRWHLTAQGWLLSNRIILSLNEAQEKSSSLAKRR